MKRTIKTILLTTVLTLGLASGSALAYENPLHAEYDRIYSEYKQWKEDMGYTYEQLGYAPNEQSLEEEYGLQERYDMARERIALQIEEENARKAREREEALQREREELEELKRSKESFYVPQKKEYVQQNYLEEPTYEVPQTEDINAPLTSMGERFIEDHDARVRNANSNIMLQNIIRLNDPRSLRDRRKSENVFTLEDRVQNPQSMNMNLSGKATKINLTSDTKSHIRVPISRTASMRFPNVAVNEYNVPMSMVGSVYAFNYKPANNVNVDLMTVLTKDSTVSLANFYQFTKAATTGKMPKGTQYYTDNGVYGELVKGKENEYHLALVDARGTYYYFQILTDSKTINKVVTEIMSGIYVPNAKQPKVTRNKYVNKTTTLEDIFRQQELEEAQAKANEATAAEKAEALYNLLTIEKQMKDAIVNEVVDELTNNVDWNSMYKELTTK